MRRIIFAAALVLSPLVLPSPGWGLQLSDLKTNCRTALRDTTSDTNFQRFSDAQLTSFVNDGQNQINNVVEPLLGAYQFDLTAGSREYALPTDFKAMYRVTLNNQRLQGTGYNALDANFTNWTTGTSTSTMYYLNAYSSVTASIQIGFYPTPRFTTSGKSVLLFYFQAPALLVSDTDVPFNGRRSLYAYHDLLTHFCAMRGWAVQNRTDLAKIYGDLFSQGVVAMKNDINFMPDYNPAATGYRGPPTQ